MHECGLRETQRHHHHDRHRHGHHAWACERARVPGGARDVSPRAVTISAPRHNWGGHLPNCNRAASPLVKKSWGTASPIANRSVRCGRPSVHGAGWCAHRARGAASPWCRSSCPWGAAGGGLRGHARSRMAANQYFNKCTRRHAEARSGFQNAGGVRGSWRKRWHEGLCPWCVAAVGRCGGLGGQLREGWHAPLACQIKTLLRQKRVFVESQSAETYEGSCTQAETCVCLSP